MRSGLGAFAVARLRLTLPTLLCQGKGFEPSGTQHSCFGNCAELSLNVIKGSWIPAVLVCRPKDPLAAMQDAIARDLFLLWCSTARGNCRTFGLSYLIRLL